MVQYGIEEETAPAVEPVTLAEMKAHLRVDITDEDDMITSMIKAARMHMVTTLDMSMVNTSWLLTLDRFSDVIKLPRSRASSVTSVKYDDSAATEQTLSSGQYRLDAKSFQSKITLAINGAWPSTADQTGAVRIIYVAGEGAAASNVPDPLKQALKLIVADMFEIREPNIMGVTVTEHKTYKRLVYPFTRHTNY